MITSKLWKRKKERQLLYSSMTISFISKTIYFVTALNYALIVRKCRLYILHFTGSLYSFYITGLDAIYFCRTRKELSL